MAEIPADGRVKRAVETFVYGYPLACDLDEPAKLPAGSSTVLAGRVVPWNQFGYGRALLTPDTEFVTPNNDTLYMVAAVDVGPGPLVRASPTPTPTPSSATCWSKGRSWPRFQPGLLRTGRRRHVGVEDRRPEDRLCDQSGGGSHGSLG